MSRAWAGRNPRNPIPDEKRDGVLVFIAAFTKERGYSPTIREIGEAVGIDSTATVHGIVKRFEKEGRLISDTDDRMRVRTLRVAE